VLTLRVAAAVGTAEVVRPLWVPAAGGVPVAGVVVESTTIAPICDVVLAAADESHASATATAGFVDAFAEPVLALVSFFALTATSVTAIGPTAVLLAKGLTFALSVHAGMLPGASTAKPSASITAALPAVTDRLTSTLTLQILTIHIPVAVVVEAISAGGLPIQLARFFVSTVSIKAVSGAVPVVVQEVVAEGLLLSGQL